MKGERRWCGVERLEDRRLFSAGDLDPTFGTGGINDHLQFPGGFGTPIQVADSDSRNGKTVLAVNQQFLIRLDNTGQPDPSFGNGGLAPIPYDYTRAVLVQPDNKVLAVVRTGAEGVQFGVARFNADGAPDLGFGVKGLQDFGTTAFHGITGLRLARDGKIVVGGQLDALDENPTLVAARLRADGRLDPTFGKGGVADTHVAGRGGVAAVQSDGKVLLTGTHPTYSGRDGNAIVVRLAAAGAVDASFGSAGVFRYGTAQAPVTFYGALDLTPDGRAVLGVGEAGGRVRVLRLSPSGKPDLVFDPIAPGAGTLADVASLRVSFDGAKLVVEGGADLQTYFGTTYVARFDADGTADHTFGGGPGFVLLPGITLNETLDLQSDQKIVVADNFSNPANFLIEARAARLQWADDTHGIVLATDGTLYVEGTTGNDTISISAQPAAGGLPDRVRVLSGATVRYFNRSQVRRIAVEGNLGDDRITVNAYAIPATVDGGPGNDILTGGAANDTLRGRGGFDQIFGRGGDDLLDGGDQNDLLDGGAGRDRLYGGNGNDALYARDGLADYLDGGAGFDSAQKDAIDAMFAIEQLV